MRGAALIAAVGFGVSAPPLAAQETVFACFLRDATQVLSITREAGQVTYRYGGIAGVDLTISTDIALLDVTPWAGIGRYIHESVAFENGGYSYQVHVSFDKLVENADVEGGVFVLRGDDVVADIPCDAGTVYGGVFAFSDMMAHADLVWDREAQLWRRESGD